ncbi:hypothetical protein L207DRAFT_535610 [Hyaloscypha variabilis F]|uniref:Uncharacterized protein n=1 Tax=Hyaloscypha variabilis (strain UAMH 11265 / GT02V1 / F) TaxID=1149755 RepID=A0A2J6R2Y4_HYAVF|nr:hypothetical protein L207DRAFT_535610 [Hyaloscypha variabilis F]
MELRVKVATQTKFFVYPIFTRMIKATSTEGIFLGSAGKVESEDKELQLQATQIALYDEGLRAERKKMRVREFEARKEKLTQGTSLMEMVLVQPRTVGNVSTKCSFTTTPFCKDSPVEFDTDIRCADLGEEAGYANAKGEISVGADVVENGEEIQEDREGFFEAVTMFTKSMG